MIRPLERYWEFDHPQAWGKNHLQADEWEVIYLVSDECPDISGVTLTQWWLCDGVGMQIIISLI